MDIKPGEITDILKREIRDYDREIDVAETGTVLSAGDGIARVYGLEKALAGELVEFPGGISGMVLNLEEDNVGIAVMGESSSIKEGDLVRRTGRIVQTGTQSRSSHAIRDAVAWLQGGGLGKIHHAQGMCYKPRRSIGKVSGFGDRMAC